MNAAEAAHKIEAAKDAMANAEAAGCAESWEVAHAQYTQAVSVWAVLAVQKPETKRQALRREAFNRGWRD